MFYDNDYNGEIHSKQTKFIKNFKKSMSASLDKNLLSIEDCPMMYNFDWEDGVLKDGLGVRDLVFHYAEYNQNATKTITSPTANTYIKGCWFFKKWDRFVKVYSSYLIVYTSDKKFYYNNYHSNDSNLTLIPNLEFTEKPMVTSCRINGEDVLILISKTDGMYTWKYPISVDKINNAPQIKSLCIHNDRMFATLHGDGRSIIFSDSLDPTNFNLSMQDGGVIDISDGLGLNNKVVSFKGYVYVFRDFNISKITTYANKDDFTISQLYVSNGLIFDKTVCICGDKILYLATDGIYSFDGNKSTRLNLGIDNLLRLDNYFAIGVYSNGYYYLACNLQFDDNVLNDNLHQNSLYNNALIRINVATGDLSILRGCSITDMNVISDSYRNEVCVNVSINGLIKFGLLDQNGKLFNNSTLKVWKSAISDFDYPTKYKVVQEVSLETHQNITLEIVTEDGIKSFEVKGKEGTQIIKPYVRGKKIGINFKSATVDNYISKPKITVGYL